MNSMLNVYQALSEFMFNYSKLEAENERLKKDNGNLYQKCVELKSENETYSKYIKDLESKVK